MWCLGEWSHDNVFQVCQVICRSGLTPQYLSSQGNRVSAWYNPNERMWNWKSPLYMMNVSLGSTTAYAFPAAKSLWVHILQYQGNLKPHPFLQRIWLHPHIWSSVYPVLHSSRLLGNSWLSRSSFRPSSPLAGHVIDIMSLISQNYSNYRVICNQH